MSPVRKSRVSSVDAPFLLLPSFGVIAIFNRLILLPCRPLLHKESGLKEARAALLGLTVSVYVPSYAVFPPSAPPLMAGQLSDSSFLLFFLARVLTPLSEPF